MFLFRRKILSKVLNMNNYYPFLLFQFLGILSLLNFNIDKRIFVWISFLFGIIVSVQVSLISIYFTGILHNILFICVICALMCFNLYKYINNREIFSKINFIDLLIIFIFIFIIVEYLPLIAFSPDSYHYHGIIDAISDNKIDPAFFKEFSWYLVDARLIFFDLIFVIGKGYNIELFSTIFAVTCFISIFLIIRLVSIFKDNSLSSVKSMFLILFIFLFILTINIIVRHSFYMHSNLITGVFYSIGTLLLFISYSEKINDKSLYIILGLIFLAFTIMIRKEMVVMTLLPIGIFFLYHRIDIKKYFLYISVYFILAYQWIFYYLIEVNDFEYILKNTSGHGGIKLYLIGFFVFLFPIILKIFYKYISLNKTNSFLWITYLIMIIFLFFIDMNETIKTIQNLFFYTFLRFKYWSLFWFVLLFSMIYLYKDRFISLFSHLIAIYVVLRLYLYVFIDSLKDHGSGDRMMIHIFFIAIFIIVYALNNIVLENKGGNKYAKN